MRLNRSVILSFIALVCCPAFAINKCKDATGKVTYQEQACEAATTQSNVKVWKEGEAQAPVTKGKNDKTGIELVSLQEVSIVMSQKPGSPRISVALHPRWKNDNPGQVRVHYKTQFFDSAKMEIGVDTRYRDLDPKSYSTTVQQIGHSAGKPSDRIDYMKVSSAKISYRTDKDGVEKVINNVSIKKTSE